MVRMSLEEFQNAVYEAWVKLPRKFKDKMENVSIMVHDLPSRRVVEEMNLSSPFQLFGLYRGIPLTKRGIHYANVMPDTIYIYRLPILRFCRNREEVRKKAYETLVHEIGHYFGLDEEEVRKALGQY